MGTENFRSDTILYAKLDPASLKAHMPWHTRSPPITLDSICNRDIYDKEDAAREGDVVHVWHNADVARDSAGRASLSIWRFVFTMSCSFHQRMALAHDVERR